MRQARDSIEPGRHEDRAQLPTLQQRRLEARPSDPLPPTFFADKQHCDLHDRAGPNAPTPPIIDADAGDIS